MIELPSELVKAAFKHAIEAMARGCENYRNYVATYMASPRGQRVIAEKKMQDAIDRNESMFQ